MTQKQAVLTIPLEGSHLGDGEGSTAGQVCPNRATEDGHINRKQSSAVPYGT